MIAKLGNDLVNSKHGNGNNNTNACTSVGPKPMKESRAMCAQYDLTLVTALSSISRTKLLKRGMCDT